MPADGHLQAGARPAARLARELEGAAVECDRVIACDAALFLVTEDLLEVHAAERDEGAVDGE